MKKAKVAFVNCSKIGLSLALKKWYDLKWWNSRILYCVIFGIPFQSTRTHFVTDTKQLLQYPPVAELQSKQFILALQSKPCHQQAPVQNCRRRYDGVWKWLYIAAVTVTACRWHQVLKLQQLSLPLPIGGGNSTAAHLRHGSTVLYFTLQKNTCSRGRTFPKYQNFGGGARGTKHCLLVE